MRVIRLIRVATLIGSALVASVPGFGAELKIGFVNAAKIVDDAPQAEEARKRIEAEFAPRDRGLVDMQNTLREAEEKLQSEGATMNEDERRGLERDVLTQKRELKRAQDEFREDLNIRRNEEFAKLQRLVADVITEMAREQNFDLIVNEASVIYASDRMETTDLVLERLKNLQ